MNNGKKIQIGFTNIPKKTILIEDNILTGKKIVLSSGLKFVIGYTENYRINKINKNFNSVAIYNQQMGMIDFNVDITYQIAGGINFRDDDFFDYRKYIELCAYEESDTEYDWLGQKTEKNMNMFYKNTLDCMDMKGLRKWWKENHPIIQYYANKKDIESDNSILKEYLKSSLQECYENTDNFSSLDKSKYKDLYFKMKKIIISLGLELLEIRLNNVITENGNIELDLVLNDECFKNNDSKNEFIVDYAPLYDNVKEKKEFKEEKFIVDYAPLDIVLKPKKEFKEKGFILDYAPLEDAPKQKPVIKEPKFILDYAPLEIDDEYETDCQEIDEIFELNDQDEDNMLFFDEFDVIDEKETIKVLKK